MVYVLSDGSGWVKIGITQDIQQRIKNVQTGNPRPIVLLKSYEVDFGHDKSFRKYHDQHVESALHQFFSEYRSKSSSRSEWFEEDPVRKLIDMTDDETEVFFKSLLENTNIIVRSTCGSTTMAGIIEENTRLKTELERLKDDNERLRRKCGIFPWNKEVE